jgi:hypothetical protein
VTLPSAALTVARLLKAAFSEIDPQRPGRAGKWLALVPHVRAVLDAGGGTRHSIASMLADQGQAADAEAEFRQVLDARLQVLGPGHPDTLATREAIRRLSG